MGHDFEKEYAKYNVAKVYLSYEGIKYEFLREKYIKLLTNYIKNESYYASMPERELFTNFLADLNDKLNNKRFAPRCNSGRSYERNFEGIAIKGEKPESAAAEERCVNIIRDMELFFETKLLSNPDDVMKKKNEYIHALILPFIDLMAKTDLYYYIPHTIKATGHNCYRNQFKMIEDNIQILFDGEESDETFKLWQEIIEPLRNIIGGDYPGIKSGIWLDANSNLAYFDCVYEIAEKDYQLYKEIIKKPKFSKIHFNITIGDNKTEVVGNLKERKAYFDENKIKDYETEQQAFFAEFKKAYLDIVKQYMYIDCIEI